MSKKNLMATFEVARGTKGVKAGWLAVLGPHVPPFAASVDQEEAGVSCKHHCQPAHGGVIFGGGGELSSVELRKRVISVSRTQPWGGWVALTVPGADSLWSGLARGLHCGREVAPWREAALTHGRRGSRRRIVIEDVLLVR